MMGTPPRAQAVAAAAATGKNEMTTEETKKKMLLLVLSCGMLALGNCGGPLLTRLYFLRGGSRIWLSSFLVTAGWPLVLLSLSLPLPGIITGQVRCPATTTPGTKLPLFAAAAGIGILTGLDDYLYASGVARLPVSTSALVLATHLAFTAGFAFLLVRHRFTPYSINAVVLLTIGAAVLGLRADRDRPAGESKGEYYVGFFMTVAGSALYGFVLPAVELAYSRAKKRGGTASLSLRVVMETQMVMSLFATGFCAVGMAVNHDFEAIPKEAREYELGAAMYYVVLVCNAVVWQFFFIGAVGVIYCASSLFSAIVIASLVPVTGILAVIFYHEKFHAEKGVALALSLWGFASYFYGEFKHAREEEEQTPQLEMTQAPNV